MGHNINRAHNTVQQNENHGTLGPFQALAEIKIEPYQSGGCKLEKQLHLTVICAEFRKVARSCTQVQYRDPAQSWQKLKNNI